MEAEEANVLNPKNGTYSLGGAEEEEEGCPWKQGAASLSQLRPVRSLSLLFLWPLVFMGYE